MPTPVSALIHAATLVTAGVYVMVRLSIFYDDFILVVGSLTALMAGVFGFFQNDLKRVIAFSTCSQLGYSQKLNGIKTYFIKKDVKHFLKNKKSSTFMLILSLLFNKSV